MTSPFTKTILIALLTVSLSGCCLIKPGARQRRLSASQKRSQELFAETEQLRMANSQAQNTIAGIEAERQMLAGQLGQMQNQLATANSRIDNLLGERTQLKQQYAGVLQDTSSDPILSSAAPTGASVPGFQYDELTGLSRFPEDVLFDLGSAELRPESYPVLKQFASKANASEASGLRILIVGHTDDQVISRGGTAGKHPTNWHLSTDRADEVILELERLGVESTRIASMGYSKFQPLDASIDESARRRNRRVELYLVPDSANLAIWDPIRSLN
ncbi:MAG: OmpA family protein [Planctomycetaceae bacterium]|nr:OmpA family protein [Planctomycetaceae bacterium]